VSFLKRLALFVLILAAMILFFGLFPVIAQGALPDNASDSVSSKLLRSDKTTKNLNFMALLP